MTETLVSADCCCANGANGANVGAGRDNGDNVRGSQLILLAWARGAACGWDYCAAGRTCSVS